MSLFRRRLLMMMQKVQEIWRDVVLTGTGLVVANDTTERQTVKIVPQGVTGQESTTGAQLFDSSIINDVSGFHVDEDGFIFQESYNTGSTKTLKEIIPYIEVGKTYYLSAEADNPSEFTGFFGLSKPWYKNKTFIPEEEDLNTVVAFVGKTGGNGKYRLMISEGSTALPYEPYTGGQPSPSPSYPQPILNAGTYNEEIGRYEYEVKISGSNLYDSENEKSGYYTGNGLEIGSAGDLRKEKYSDIFKVLNGTTALCISITCNFPEENDGYYCAALFLDIDKTVITKSTVTLYNRNIQSGIEKTYYIGSIKIPDGTAYIGLCHTSYGNGKLMVNYGEFNSNAMPYEPYKTPQSVTLTSDRPLTKWDRLVYMDGQWQWEYKSVNILIDRFIGAYTAGGITGFYTEEILEDKYSARDGFSEKTIVTNMFYPPIDLQCICIGRNNKNIYFFGTEYFDISLPDKGLQNINNYVQENPFNILTYSDIPEYIPLPESEQQALNAMTTYYPTTVFSNDQNGFMQIEYRTKYGNVVYIDDGFLEPDTSTATSKPTQNATFSHAWCSTSIPVTFDDTIEVSMNGIGAISQTRLRLYDTDGSFESTYSTGYSWKIQKVGNVVSVGYARFMYLANDGSGLNSITVTHSDGTETVYQVIDRRSGA